MSRQETIGSFILGALLFVGLFVFIYTTMKAPAAFPAEEEDYAALPYDEEFPDEMFQEGETPEPEESATPAPTTK